MGTFADGCVCAQYTAGVIIDTVIYMAQCRNDNTVAAKGRPECVGIYTGAGNDLSAW